MQILESAANTPARLPNFGCTVSLALVHTGGQTPFDAWEGGVLTPCEVATLRYLGRDEEADPTEPQDVWEAEVHGQDCKVFVAQPCEDSLWSPVDVREMCDTETLADTVAGLTGLSNEISKRIASVWAGIVADDKDTGGYDDIVDDEIVNTRLELYQTRHRGEAVARFLYLDGVVRGLYVNGPEGDYAGILAPGGALVFAPAPEAPAKSETVPAEAKAL